MNNSNLPKCKNPVKQKTKSPKPFTKSSAKKDRLREARATAVMNLIKASGCLELSGQQYGFLRRQYGLTKANIDESLNILLDSGQISVRADAGFLLLEIQ